MKKEQVDRLREKYLPLGIVWGVEFVLPPEVAINFLHDLAEMGIVVVGYDQWQYVDRCKREVMELLWWDGIGEERVASVTAKEAAIILEDLLTNHLPPNTELVSFLFRDIDVNEWFSSHRFND